jgi:hypothetical protein
MSTTAKELEKIIEKMLLEGVPPGVVDRVFPGVGLDTIKEAQKQVRVAQYGTDDLNDYLEQMQWMAVEDAMTTFQTGSATERARVRSAILGKQMTAAAKRPPEGTRNQRQAFDKMFAHMRGDDA